MLHDRPRLHGLMLTTAERDPDKIAFVSAKHRATYAELGTHAVRFAGALRELGLRRGDRVVVVLDGTPEYLSAYYGVLAAGGVVVPHGTDTRRELLRRAIEHSEAFAVVLEASRLSLLDGLGSALPSLHHVITVGGPAESSCAGLDVTDLAVLTSHGRELFDGEAKGDDLASIVFTSGTTGQPKGVMLSHANIVANVRSIVSYLELGPDDVVGMVLPFYYVYGTSVLHTHVAVGGTIAMIGTLTFPAALLNGIARYRCTGFAGVPSTYARLVRMDLSPFDLSSLRYLTQAGGPMSPALTEHVRAVFPHARLFVMYGQTEASARLSYVPPESLTAKLGSVGVGIPGVSLEVVDGEGRRLPARAVGEVVAQGPNVMRGYWKDPEGTARVLRDGRLHTGDLGWLDEDGYLYLVGRESDIIKSGAHRIGPREIEEVIERLSGVVQCAVVGLPDELLGEVVAALVVPGPGAALTKEAVQRHAMEQLPRHKVPTTVHFVSELPRTANGKLQRSALRELAMAAGG